MNLRSINYNLKRIIQHRRKPTLCRMSSFPLISGDSFAFACDYHPFEDPYRNDYLVRTTEPKWFVEISSLANPQARSLLLDLAQHSDHQPTLVLHNGDILPPDHFFESACSIFKTVFSVNIVEEGENLRAIPIGIENYWHRGPWEFRELLQGLVSEHFERDESPLRTTSVFASFNEATNLDARRPLINLLESKGLKNEQVSRSNFKIRLRDSLFVISPPGNGNDCHRTWESIYLGAVPVVLESALSKRVYEDSRILSVKSWHQFFDLADTELIEIFQNYSIRSLDKALMPYWLNQLAGNQ